MCDRFYSGKSDVSRTAGVPIAAYFMVGADQVTPILEQSGVVGGASAYLSLFRNGDRSYTAVEIISQLAWGLDIVECRIF